jgi:hypothetical protein
MEIGLRSAFIISAIIHAGFAVPFYNHSLLKAHFEKRNAVIVDYVILRELSNITPANIGNKESVVVAQAPKIDVKSTPSTENKTPTKHSKLDYRKKLKAIRSKEKPEAKVSAKQTVSGADKKESQIKSSKDYIDYYGSLKEKIKARLQENYKFYTGEGDVYLSFVLSAKGALVSYNIDRSKSSKDEVLLQITRASLMAVAPFAPIPRSISEPQASFNITISFKRQ